jgi:diacylglycerol kinase family enzyme
MQIELQGMLAEFKVAGEIGRITALRSMRDLVETANQRGVKTLIACGTDDTFIRMLAELRGKDFALGFIPFDPNSYLAKIFGVESIYTAVKTIAARRIEKIDLGVISPHTYFLSYLEFGNVTAYAKNLSFWSAFKSQKQTLEKIAIRIDDSYTIETEALGGLVVNTRPTSSKNATVANPTDSFLDVLLLEKLTRSDIIRYKNVIAAGLLEHIPHTTVIKCRKVEFLEPKNLPIQLGDRMITKVPASVQIIPNRLRIIVGKKRTF